MSTNRQRRSRKKNISIDDSLIHFLSTGVILPGTQADELFPDDIVFDDDLFRAVDLWKQHRDLLLTMKHNKELIWAEKEFARYANESTEKDQGSEITIDGAADTTLTPGVVLRSLHRIR